MDADAEPSHKDISPPTQQQTPPALPSGTERDQNSSPANVSLGLSASIVSNATTMPAPSASLPPVSNNTATPPPGLVSLPEELLAQTLSLLSPQEIALTCRSVCSELRNFVDRHENYIAGLKIKHKHAELQRRMDTLTQMKPHDLASFVSSFHYWVAQRGLAKYRGKGRYRNFTGWVNLMLGLDINEQRQTTLRWRDLTNLLMRMQYNIVRTPVIAHARILSDVLSNVKPGDRDYAQYADLCNLISTQPVSQLLFDCQQLDVEGGEEYQAYPVFRLNRIIVVSRGGPHVLDPFCPPGSDVQLALPRLPAARFCYYVEEVEEWYRTALNAGATLSPLAKAAFLEGVKIY
jgi:hypothetical protein